MYLRETVCDSCRKTFKQSGRAFEAKVRLNKPQLCPDCQRIVTNANQRERARLENEERNARRTARQ